LLKMPRSQVGLWPKDLKRTLLLKRRAEKCVKLARVQYSFLLVVMAKKERFCPLNALSPIRCLTGILFINSLGLERKVFKD
jgi:hypothetical protein